MAKWQYTRGLHDLGNSCYAWLQPDGSWGYSNSGLIVDQGETLLVDTLMDLSHTREMLEGYRAAEVRLTNVGPAHTRGDVLAYVPGDRTVFTGDILFIGGHPAVWDGPVSNWIKACDMILGWDVETIVPGHGPITDKQGVLALKDYFEYVAAAARKRFDAGMSADETARDISLDAYRDWIDDERIVVNVHALYREFAGGGAEPNAMDMHARMARYRKERGGGRSVRE